MSEQREYREHDREHRNETTTTSVTTSMVSLRAVPVERAHGLNLRCLVWATRMTMSRIELRVLLLVRLVVPVRAVVEALQARTALVVHLRRAEAISIEARPTVLVRRLQTGAGIVARPTLIVRRCHRCRHIEIVSGILTLCIRK